MSTLTDILPTGPPTSEARTRIVEMDAEEADDVLDVLASDTRRDVYRRLLEEPATTSELADGLDTSLQNVSHHVSTLEDAELVEAVGRRYSEKGNEMVVYGPTSDPLVFVGREELHSRLDRSLSDVVAGIGLLAGGALFVQWGAYQLFSPDRAAATAIDPASYAGGSNDAGGLLVWLVFEAGEPGLLFFFACLLVAAVATVAWRR
ncbi:ArsR family transcriptional regulator [Halalkaliarchaeum desulfuricum]|uniref:ArsR family transcriptional regulator n=1 Tax=Halalkaliarchaeum desulfuricum TaxID=2055893 RepID=A0A343TFS1_9EURY|nr:helix-turn-helix domain-containing protein [Halalkaliarchaeum desulfuricum]AUX07943.1 ArsR family transcriptional regulator [Halalkaliarchaeum desulfuricum]